MHKLRAWWFSMPQDLRTMLRGGIMGAVLTAIGEAIIYLLWGHF
jgi:hypothetical protein